MAGIEPTPSKSNDLIRFRVAISAKGAGHVFPYILSFPAIPDLL
jgi:hypothetical protein